jgi:hypothetical protein
MIVDDCCYKFFLDGGSGDRSPAPTIKEKFAGGMIYERQICSFFREIPDPFLEKSQIWEVRVPNSN